MFALTTQQLRAALVVPFLGASMTLYWLSSIPELVTPDLGFTWQDKFYHVIAYSVYGVATALAVIAIKDDQRVPRLRLLTLIVAMTFAASDEIHQSFVPGRDGSIYDWVADLVGVSLALLVVPRLRRLAEYLQAMLVQHS